MKKRNHRGQPSLNGLDVDPGLIPELKEMISPDNVFAQDLEDLLPEEIASATYGEIKDSENLGEVTTGFETFSISVVEFAIYNSFLSDTLNKSIGGFKTKSYGELSQLEIIKFGGNFKAHSPWFFISEFDHKDYKNNTILFQTRIYRNSNNNVVCELNISFKTKIGYKKITEFRNLFHKISFNNSEYKGKCLEVKVTEGNFEGIKIIPTDEFETNLILTETQERFLSHFEKRVSRGNQARYLFSGEPGTGKTQAIRRIMKELVPNVTFIMPDFSTSEDLKTIMNACEVFEPGCIVIDDIDIYLGTRDHGSHTRMLADFLSYFDGVKKRNISILASTNDKKLLDRAAERPGRFNVTIDFSYLEDDQIKKVVDMHLPKKWRIDRVYTALIGKDRNGRKINVTGAFVANLAENIVEMSTDEKSWSVDDTVTLIEDSYAGFYNSQMSKSKPLGFRPNN